MICADVVAAILIWLRLPFGVCLRWPSKMVEILVLLLQLETDLTAGGMEEAQAKQLAMELCGVIGVRQADVDAFVSVHNVNLSQIRLKDFDWKIQVLLAPRRGHTSSVLLMQGCVGGTSF